MASMPRLLPIHLLLLLWGKEVALLDLDHVGLHPLVSLERGVCVKELASEARAAVHCDGEVF